MKRILVVDDDRAILDYPAVVALKVRPVHICLRKPIPPGLLRDTVEYLVRDAPPHGTSH
jgi:hypothetical protein